LKAKQYTSNRSSLFSKKVKPEPVLPTSAANTALAIHLLQLKG